MASGADGCLLVGFICPICKTDLVSAELLLKHYSTHREEDSEHVITQRVESSKDIFVRTIELQTSSYDRVFGKHSENRRPVTVDETDSIFSVKKILEKAKQLTTNFDKVFGPTSEVRRPVTISEAELRSKDLVELFSGKTDEEKVKLSSRSFTDHYVELRSAKLKNQGTEANIMLQNFEKYFNNEKADRSFWQRLKNFVDTEPEAKMCVTCKKPFKLTRRKHHCKLCVATLCIQCSLYDDANIIGSMLSLEVKEVPPKKSAKPLRHCKDCNLLLKVLKARSNEDDQVTKLIETYKEMQNLKRQISKTVITYKEIHESLVKGKITHDLSQAAMVREHIGKRGREIAVLGKLFGEIPTQPGTRLAKLYATIAKATDDFVKELLALPKVPAASAIEEARLKRLSNCSSSSGLEWDEL